VKELGYQLTVKKIASPSFLPDFTAEKVEDINFKQLEKLGVKHLLFDLDQTLRSPYSRKLKGSVVTLLSEVNNSKQFKTLNLVSNNQRNLKRYSEPINARVFQPFRKGWRYIRKPNPLFFEQVLHELGAKPEQCVMIGDRLHADVLGGNRMGMFTIYVKKHGPIDYWFDWLLLTRLREKRRLRDAVAEHKRKRQLNR
jgi:HAD superfamily phosphatase (TIGR01668 family)